VTHWQNSPATLYVSTSLSTAHAAVIPRHRHSLLALRLRHRTQLREPVLLEWAEGERKGQRFVQVRKLVREKTVLARCLCTAWSTVSLGCSCGCAG
jgi:hypothetical protein